MFVHYSGFLCQFSGCSLSLACASNIAKLRWADASILDWHWSNKMALDPSLRWRLDRADEEHQQRRASRQQGCQDYKPGKQSSSAREIPQLGDGSWDLEHWQLGIFRSPGKIWRYRQWRWDVEAKAGKTPKFQGDSPAGTLALTMSIFGIWGVLFARSSTLCKVLYMASRALLPATYILHVKSPVWNFGPLYLLLQEGNALVGICKVSHVLFVVD